MKQFRKNEMQVTGGMSNGRGCQKTAASSIIVRSSIAIVLALSCLFTLGGLAGCGKVEEELIRQSVITQFDSLKDQNSDEYKQLIKEIDTSLTGTNFDTKKLVETWLDGFDYEIGDVKVENGTASVEISITAKQLLPVISATVNEVIANQGNYQSQEDTTAAYERGIIDKLKQAKLETSKLVMNCTKPDGQWVPTSAWEDDLMGALLGDASGLFSN